MGTSEALINNTLKEIQSINYSMSEQFKFDKWQFCIVTTKDNIEYVDFVFPNDKNLKNKVIQYMSNEGFYYNDAGTAFVDYLERIHSINYNPTSEEIDVLNDWTLFRFFPIKPNNIISIIKKHTKYLIHLTPEENVSKILEEGIQCHNDSHLSYPQRICLIVPSREDRVDWIVIKEKYVFRNYIYALINRLNEYRKERKLPFTTFKALIIDINKLPNDSCLYIDTPSYPYAVFTYKNISADNIERIESIDEVIAEFS